MRIRNAGAVPKGRDPCVHCRSGRCDKDSQRERLGIPTRLSCPPCVRSSQGLLVVARPLRSFVRSNRRRNTRLGLARALLLLPRCRCRRACHTIVCSLRAVGGGVTNTAAPPLLYFSVGGITPLLQARPEIFRFALAATAASASASAASASASAAAAAAMEDAPEEEEGRGMATSPLRAALSMMMTTTAANGPGEAQALEAAVREAVRAHPGSLWERDGDGFLPLHVALMMGTPLRLIHLLVRAAGPDALRAPTQNELRMLPLHVPVVADSPIEVIQFLVDEATGPLQEPDGSGLLPLHAAAQRSSPFLEVMAVAPGGPVPARLVPRGDPRTDRQRRPPSAARGGGQRLRPGRRRRVPRRRVAARPAGKVARGRRGAPAAPGRRVPISERAEPRPPRHEASSGPVGSR
jgi:hypothetical protein